MLPLLRTLTRYPTGRRVQRDRGASAVEYGLLVAAIAAVIVAVMFIFGGTLKNVFSDTCGNIAGGGSPSTCQQR